MKLLVQAACIAASSGFFPAWADQHEDSNLYRAMSVILADTLLPHNRDIAWYYDISLLADLHEGVLNGDSFRRLIAAQDIRAVFALAMAGPDAWQEKTGIAPAQLRFVSQFGQPPLTVTYLGVADDAVAATAFDALAGQGFEPTDASPDITANGPPGRMDRAAADPRDPWRGAMGQSSFVMLSEAGLFQATDPAPLQEIQKGTSLADTPFGKTLLGALEAQDGTVLQAALLGPAAGLQGAPAQIMVETSNPDAMQKAVDDAQDRMAQGLPLYGGLAIADLVHADGSVTVLAFAYSDCETAEGSAATAAELWPESGMGMVEGQATPSHVDVQDAGCAAVITIPEGQNGSQFDRVMGALMQRNLAAIRIGQE